MNINVQISALADLIVTADTKLQAVIFTCTPAAGGATQRVAIDATNGVTPGMQAQFVVTDPGVYELSAQALSVAEALLGNPANTTVTVTAPATITIQVPGAITATAV